MTVDRYGEASVVSISQSSFWLSETSRRHPPWPDLSFPRVTLGVTSSRILGDARGTRSRRDAREVPCSLNRLT